ncbi:ThuA domain-containing protein [Jannaschia sp. CCS1]|uniref:ThuA domain-containing protein n=1 Tax=Jannaschia sp. (strain CCS1) TaxID=290400 RepID=UPI000053A198|nr:ThuA domain-containing protein [Jannaschia sp. CCS1]ABD55187.1 hypothetical protein Jann_2270 [Jannaschia sp. CCS1]
MSPRSLILSGGILHPFDQTSDLIAQHLTLLGIRSEILPVREGLARLGQTSFDLLAVNALAFTMTQHEKYASRRATHSFAISKDEKTAIRSHVQAGGKLLGLHTAAICFDDWPEWRDLLGVAWKWGVSHHPPPCPVRVADTPPFDTVDELYCDMSVHPDAEVLLTGTCDGVAEPQPILIRFGNAAYLALGHDKDAVQDPGYVRLLKRATRALFPPNSEDAHAID